MLRYDLHRHLEGSHSPRALLTVARELGLRDPLFFDAATGRLHDEATLAARLTMRGPGPATEFYGRIELARVAYVSVAAIARLAALAFEEVQAEADHAELRVSLFSMTRTLLSRAGDWRAVPPTRFAAVASEILEALLAARDGQVRASGRALPIRLGLSRTFESAPHYEALGDMVREHAAALCGLDVLGIVTGDDAEPLPAGLLTILARLRAALPDLTVHAGELEGEASVARTLELSPRGIGHGVRSLESGALLERLAASGVTLEVCPSSNALLLPSVVEALTARAGAPPLVALQRAEVRCVLGSDDPTIFGATTAGEYERARALGADLHRLERDARRRWAEITGQP